MQLSIECEREEDGRVLAERIEHGEGSPEPISISISA